MRSTLLLIIGFLAVLHLHGQQSETSLSEPFNHLKVSGNIHLDLIVSDTQKIVCHTGDIPGNVEVEVRKGVLEIKTKSELSRSAAAEAKLYYKELTLLEISKGSRIQSADTIRSGSLELHVLSGGKVELTIMVDSLTARVNQGSDIILYGRTRSQFIDAYTWGNYLAYDLEAQDSSVKAATGAQVKISTSRKLNVNATSKSFVGYKGEPTLKSVKTSVGGEVTPFSR